MEQPIGVNNVPDHVLTNIMTCLPLEDLKAVSCTNKRLSALASEVIVRRKNVALCLNALRDVPVRGHQEMQVIDRQFFRWCRRRYQHLTVDCGPSGITGDLRSVVKQIPICWEVRTLNITGEHPSVVGDFIALNLPLFSFVTDMTVRLHQKRAPRHDIGEMRCVMPNLIRLHWVDYYNRPPTRNSLKLDMYAPRLLCLFLDVTYGCPTSLSMSKRRSQLEPAVAFYAGFQTLFKLTIMLCWETWIPLRSLSLPNLRYFNVSMTTSMSPCQEFWRLFARRMPNLVHLRVSSCNEVYRLRLFISLKKLETLELVGGRIEIEQDAYQEVQAMRKLCLFGCVLSDECGTVKFCRLESLCLVSSWRKQLTWTNQDWLVPKLRYLCIESPNDVGINLRHCHKLEVLRMGITKPILILPYAMSLDQLTVFQLECRWAACSDQVAGILSRAPNLRHLQMLIRGCNLDYLEQLPRWCPQLFSLILLPDGNHPRAVVMKHQTLMAIFSLPYITEIVLGTMLVYYIGSMPIVVPWQLETLILHGILSSHHEPVLIRVDDEHPSFDAIRMHILYTQNWRVLMINPDRHQAHMRYRFSSNPFECEHIKQGFGPWLATNDRESSDE